MNSFLEEKWSLVGLGFNPWEYSRAEKQGILLAIFKALNVLTVLELSPSDMLEFCLDMESLYEDVPYHSFNHAIDVVVKLYYVLHDLQAASYLASYDIAALLISGLCHDCGHVSDYHACAFAYCHMAVCVPKSEHSLKQM
ncbi:hypothetical protein LPJ62_001253 [Coemansia sp. RSA 2167]|nr:hypothetical protein LPJ62_001253 [Coemansia sp. RSA 2167]KAJ2130569.1 hypothetical protein IW136_005527 [Coemansia sp. RSA 678]KAJ2535383.1 hypothetical protein IWW35_006799 [Coemansia sp. RSA 1878]